MATLQQERSKAKSVWRIQWIDSDKKRRRVRLGDIPENTARFIFSQVDQLIASASVGQPIPSGVRKWLAKLDPELHDKLSAAGLCDAKKSANLAEFIDGYIASRTEAAENTVRNWTNSRQKLTDFFGEDRDWRSITAGDADDWRQSLVNKGHANATISKAVKHAKHFAKAAHRKRYCDGNPFDGLIAGGETNDERQAFVTLKTIQKVLDSCPNAEWRAIVCLSRFGGLRCPSETLALRWTDIDWAGDRFTVRRGKTKRRDVPLFPELRKALLECQEAAPEGSQFVVSRYRSANSNLRTQLLRIIDKAGVEPWERLFHNLRASRETELMNDFPTHVVCGWIGNDEKTARDHYLQITDGHYAQASGGGAQGGAWTPQNGQVGHEVGRRQPAGSSGKRHVFPEEKGNCAKSSGSGDVDEYPLGECEHCRNQREYSQVAGGVGHQAGHGLQWVIDAWPHLSAFERNQILDIVGATSQK